MDSRNKFCFKGIQFALLCILNKTKIWNLKFKPNILSKWKSHRFAGHINLVKHFIFYIYSFYIYYSLQETVCNDDCNRINSLDSNHFINREKKKLFVFHKSVKIYGLTVNWCDCSYSLCHTCTLEHVHAYDVYRKICIFKTQCPKANARQRHLTSYKSQNGFKISSLYRSFKLDFRVTRLHQSLCQTSEKYSIPAWLSSMLSWSASLEKCCTNLLYKKNIVILLKSKWIE